ncbi:hypothetical protein NEUTE1DRAFT_63869 [Neurospora tetrasperma FGSC 2508]|uniref:PLC-like phosphodiesterase n=1 Tax=Neurospora tetrasperma (strain FGSC 2508 / ATCC MYA-4615 / P0657) TaxID=510951 RepID=F8MKD7_NEUT8|nr:uncharacterized protein NEUTE1DRAFT_63869 [Neurospora tetrasperma FGSC 2508]EGO58218.1 hypothetical protein NEUTE1DRAFT_63869 [Neurospora tetrasperma FGSC 2508]EGZ71466.1 hypothetical protein NEUTE2DRAFT_157669 [Neurospora tetrasperma FGSC 2509]
MAVLFWVLHLLFFSLLTDLTTGNPLSTSPSPSQPGEEEDSFSSVADLALQKILGDGRQIFGTFPSSFNKSAASKRRAQWMTPLPDSLPLTRLRAIPGTHDSATWNFTTETRNSIPSNPSYLPAEWFRCQKKSILESLEAGVRFFDLRTQPAHTPLTPHKSNASFIPSLQPRPPAASSTRHTPSRPLWETPVARSSSSNASTCPTCLSINSWLYRDSTFLLAYGRRTIEGLSWFITNLTWVTEIRARE